MASFEELVGKIRSLGFDIEIEKHIEKDEEYVCREACGWRRVDGFIVSVRLVEVDGEVTALLFEIPDLHTGFSAGRYTAREVERLYRRAVEAIKGANERRRQAEEIGAELRRMGFEVAEGVSHMEAWYRLGDSATDFIRVTINFKPDRVGECSIVAQKYVNCSNVVEVARRLVEALKS